MTRVPAAAALLLLSGSGIVISPATLRQWKRRGHLSDGRGYDPRELLAHVERRSTRPLTCA